MARKADGEAVKRDVRFAKAAAILQTLGADPRLLDDRCLPIFAEARMLRHVGVGSDGRDKFLMPPAAKAWRTMCAAAAAEGVQLRLISAFRSIEYQAHIIRLKLANGRSLDEILQVNAPPGCSEHHTGRAIDIGCGDRPTLDDSFETTDAFRWLIGHAPSHGFLMSYPRENQHGYLYEPWHWCWHRILDKQAGHD